MAGGRTFSWWGRDMVKWSDLQQEFRRVVLQRGEKTLHDVAEEAGIGRTTVYEIMSNRRPEPRPSVRHCVERYVAEFENERSTDTD